MAAQREGQTWLSLRESWQRAALTEREPLKQVQGGAKRAHPRLACRRVPARGNIIPPLKDAPGFWGGFPAALRCSPPDLACRVGKLCAAHPLTPSRAQTIAKAIPSLAREGE